jgi:hypothetical protein
VPAAINLYRVRQAGDGSRELFLSIQRQKDQYQGIWIVSPDGRVLAARHDYADFENGARELLETIDAGLASFAPLEPRRVQPAETIPREPISAEMISGFLPRRKRRSGTVRPPGAGRRPRDNPGRRRAGPGLAVGRPVPHRRPACD